MKKKLWTSCKLSAYANNFNFEIDVLKERFFTRWNFSVMLLYFESNLGQSAESSHQDFGCNLEILLRIVTFFMCSHKM